MERDILLLRSGSNRLSTLQISKVIGSELYPCSARKDPKTNTDKIKTDKRDAIKLARLMRSGELESIHVPSEEDEAVRDYLDPVTVFVWI